MRGYARDIRTYFRTKGVSSTLEPPNTLGKALSIWIECEMFHGITRVESTSCKIFIPSNLTGWLTM